MHTFIFLFEEPKVIFKSRKRGGHGEMKSDKRTNNDQQNITEKTKDLPQNHISVLSFHIFIVSK
jgi:hypothetical protein